VLVGHSYGGNVISTAATGNDQEQALVYFNGWMCDEGESQQQLLEAQADWTNLESPETYLGYQQGHNFASPGGVTVDEPRSYSVPEVLRLNSWALSGDWTVEGRASVLNSAGGRIAYRFHARDVHLVLRSRAQATPVPFRMLLDGTPPGAAHGLDVDDQGHGTLVQPRLYQLIRQSGSISDRTFEITFLAGGVEAYVFTFG
jgi:pimeloyl-ACP methyl ester carboxylesterase